MKKRLLHSLAFLMISFISIAQTTTYNWADASFGASATQAKRYTIGRIYYNDFHWGEYGSILLKLTARYFRSTYVEYLIQPNPNPTIAGGKPVISCLGVAGSLAPSIKVELGEESSAETPLYSGYSNYYRNIYLDADYYSQWSVQAEVTGTNFHLDRTSLTSESDYTLITLYSSPTSENIESFMSHKMVNILSENASVYIPGNLNIGAIDTSAALNVNGNIKTRKIIVTRTGWSDYVFDKHYTLRSLSSLEAFIQQNKHLPEIPSAKEVEEKGMSVGDNQALLLKKIEELTLYVIDQEKRINEQGKKIIRLESKIKRP